MPTSEPTFSTVSIMIAEGRVYLAFVNQLGERERIDLTAEIERIAAAKVFDHMKEQHGHML